MTAWPLRAALDRYCPFCLGRPVNDLQKLLPVVDSLGRSSPARRYLPRNNPMEPSGAVLFSLTMILTLVALWRATAGAPTMRR